MLHLQLSHAGFVLRSTAAGDVAGSAGDVAGSAGDVAGSAGTPPPPAVVVAALRRPAGWRQVPGLYTFGYSHERAQQPPLAAASAASCPPATTLTIKAIPMGPLLMVHGLLDGGPLFAQLANGGSATPPPPCVLSAQLKLTEYAKHRDVAKPVASSASGLSSLPKLVHQLSTRLVQPAREAHRALLASLPPPAGSGPSTRAVGFDDLLPELRFVILSHLDVKCLGRAMAVCTALLPLARDELLWPRLYEEAYPGEAVGGCADVDAPGGVGAGRRRSGCWRRRSGCWRRRNGCWRVDGSLQASRARRESCRGRETTPTRDAPPSS